MLLAIHDASFPADPDEDTGRGGPATRAAARLLAYARSLGFTGIQLGPQGQTARDNPSPYDGTIFSRRIVTSAPVSPTVATALVPSRATRNTLTTANSGSMAISRTMGTASTPRRHNDTNLVRILAHNDTNLVQVSPVPLVSRRAGRVSATVPAREPHSRRGMACDPRRSSAEPRSARARHAGC